MGQCIARLAHSCGSPTGLQVFQKEGTSKIDGFCFSCKTFVRHPLGEDKDDVKFIPKKARCGLSKEEQLAQIAEIESEYQTVDLVERKLRKDVLEDYGVKVGLCQKDGKTPRSICYPYRV